MEDLIDGFRQDTVSDILGVDRAVDIIVNDPSRFDEVVPGLNDPSQHVREQCAKTIRHIAQLEPHLLTDHKQILLDRAEETDNTTIKGSLIWCLPRVPLDEPEQQRVLYLLESCVYSGHTFVVIQALEALAKLGERYPDFREPAVDLLQSRSQDSNRYVASRAQDALSILPNE